MILMINNLPFKFGVEIECFGCKRIDIQNELDKLNIPCEIKTYSHGIPNAWKITLDGSVTCDGTDPIDDYYGNIVMKGIDVVSPVLEGTNGISQLRNVISVLNKLHAKIDNTASIHVHIDTSTMDYNAIKNALIFYYNYQNAIECLIHEDRRNGNNPYCLPIELEQLKKVRSADSIERIGIAMRTRKKCVNARTYRRGYNTLEFRQLHATLDFDEIYNWIMLLENIMYYCSNLDGVLKINKYDNIMDQFNKLNKDLKLYKNKRLFKYFSYHISKELHT